MAAGIVAEPNIYDKEPITSGCSDAANSGIVTDTTFIVPNSKWHCGRVAVHCWHNIPDCCY